MALLGISKSAEKRLAVVAALAMSFGVATVAFGQYNDPHWNAPQGYGDFYHENGTANPAARQGYAAGFEQGQSDARQHHSFRPTHVDTYRNVPASPGDINRQTFKNIYRQAFTHGYARGYGR